MSVDNSTVTTILTGILSQPLTWLIYVSYIVPVFMLVVVFFYTLETQKLRKISQEQTELQLRPFVMYEIEEEEIMDSKSEQLVAVFHHNKIKNIGNGPAVSIEVIDFELQSKKWKKEDMRIYLPERVLLKGQEAPLIARHKDSSYDLYDEVLFEGITIAYMNIRNRRYVTTTKWHDWHVYFEDRS